jgi:hypothetical protein
MIFTRDAQRNLQLPEQNFYCCSTLAETGTRWQSSVKLPTISLIKICLAVLSVIRTEGQADRYV